jgi:hypothetical protein
MTANSTITPELLDQLLANYEKPEDLKLNDNNWEEHVHATMRSITISRVFT